MLNESRNIAKGKVHPLCEHPERWTSRDQISTENEVMDLAWGLVRALQPSYVLETGTWAGHTAARLADALDANGHGMLYTLESNKKIHARAEAALADRLNVQAVHAISTKWLPPPGVRFGFCWFDTDPKENYPLEFRHYRPFMVPGCVVAFHDTAPHWPTRPLIDELEAEGALKAIDLVTPRGVTFGTVT